MQNANYAAFDRRDRQHQAESDFSALQQEITDRILEGKDAPEQSEFVTENVCDVEELREIIERGGDDDWQPDSCFWEHVHGVEDDR